MCVSKELLHILLASPCVVSHLIRILLINYNNVTQDFLRKVIIILHLISFYRCQVIMSMRNVLLLLLFLHYIPQ